MSAPLSQTPQTPAPQVAGVALPVAPPAAPSPSGGWLMQTARLVRWELRLARRRRGMVITLTSLGLAGYVIMLLFLFGNWAYAQSSSAIPIRGGSTVQQTLGQLISFPQAIGVAGQYFNTVGTLLFLVLVGALIGSEYSYGTHRLSLTRGVGRVQLLVAQIIAVALIALTAVGVALALGAVAGAIGGTFTGQSEAVSLAGVGELLALWLAISVNVLAYGLIALWIGTLTRSVAAAIAGPLVYIFIESVATGILGTLKYLPNPDPTTQFLSHVPDYMLGPNATEVIQLSGQSPYALLSHTGSLGLTHALIVVAVYFLLLIGTSALIFRSRDVLE